MPNEQKVTRKLRAIISADVKGYSLLMADDEAHTIQTLKVYRDLMSDLINRHSGRVVDNPGDNLLAEFSSAVNSVECAVEIQNRLKKENAKFVEEKRLQFRIGVNIGDVVHDDGRIYGSGINVAARIEAIADPGGVCISLNTYDQVKDKLELGFEYLGGHEVKNIQDPVRVYRIRLDADAPKPLVEEKLELPEKPSIAVLPFTNMSGDPDQEYFSDGLTEQIINGLCKVSNLFVIARNSSFAYKGKSVSVKQIAKELGVRYVLEGSVQRAGNRVRITAQLIDAISDFHIWSEAYDRDLEDIFALQDEITMKLISTVEVHLTFGEQARLWSGVTTSNIMAYDKLMRGVESTYRFTKHDNIQARKFANEAIELDSGYALAYVVLGNSHWNDIFYGWGDDPIESFSQAEVCAAKALELAESLDWSHMLFALIYLIKHQHDDAIKEGEKALELNPNGADILVSLAFMYNYYGNPEKGAELTKRAIRLNPLPHVHYYVTLSMSYRQLGDYDKAINESLKGVKLSPDFINPYFNLALSYAALGKLEMARDAVKEILRINPDYSLEKTSMAPYRNREELDTTINFLRKAGAPEHPPQ